MKQCSVQQLTKSLAPWLNEQYIRRVTLDHNDHIVFSFIDGVNDVYEITDCNRSQVEKLCRNLKEKGISVQVVSEENVLAG